MDIDFQTEKRDSSVGKRFRDSEEEVSEDDSEHHSELVFKVPSVEEYREAFWTHGDCMIEIFRVIVNREGYISGKIYINTGARIADLYKGEEYIKKGGDLLLTGPDVGLETYDCALTFVDLNHKTITINPESRRITRLNKGSYSESRRLTNFDGCFDEKGNFDESKYMGFYWHYQTGQHLLNKPLSHKITSGKLTATLFYAFFRAAIQATVEVRLINESSEIGVYGLISARNSMFKDPRYKSILFRKKLTERVPFGPEDPIQLSRSVLAVPVNFNLIIRVDLESKDTNIPHGELSFPVQLSGMMEKLLGNKVQVKVTWKHYWEQNSTHME